MPSAAVHVIASDANEDARSTSSTLVNGERNDIDNDNNNNNNRTNATTTTNTTTTTTTTNEEQQQQQQQRGTGSTIRHGFDHAVYEDDVLSFLHFSDKRHDTNAKPDPTVRSVSLDWVSKKKKE